MKTTLLIICATSLALASALAELPFQISLVPEGRSDQGARISWGDDSKRNFYVVLTNTTDKPRRVFNTWNSWGYQAISFEFTLSPETKINVSMKPQRFTKNVPSTFTIPPNGHQVFPITLNEAWDEKPNFGKAGRIMVKMRIVYELSETTESKENGVWTGRIESEQYRVVVNHW